jgi:hypothetical protein
MPYNTNLVYCVLHSVSYTLYPTPYTQNLIPYAPET